MSSKRDRKKQQRLRRLKAVRKGAKRSNRLTASKLLQTCAERARRTAERYLRQDPPCGGPVGVVKLADGMRELALGLMRQSPLYGRHECQPGCAFCCHTAVTVAGPEVFAIAKYLKEHLSDEELRLLRRRLDENAQLASSLTRDEYIARLIPCALMTADGNCRAHPVRPIACAGFCSTSRVRCEAEFNRVPDREPVPIDQFTMVAGLGVSNGLLEACKQAGLDGNFYELHHALRRVLDRPDAPEEWARGHNVFDGCLP